MSESSTGKLRFLVSFALYFVGVWLLWDTVIVYPLKIFVVLLHEVSHAIAVVGTGGVVDGITLDPYQGGATHFRGGSALLALNAGYLGSLLWGGLLFTAAGSRRVRSDWVNSVIGAVVIALTLYVVRSPFGIVFGLLFGFALLAVSQRVSRVANRRILWVLGLTSALYAVLDIKSDVLDRPEIASDAAVLADMIGIPTVVVGGLWIALALAFSAWMVARAYRDA